MMRLDDEILNAYVDGELDPVSHAEVETALASDPQGRARLEAIRRVSLLGRAAVDELSRGGAPDSLRERVWPVSPKPLSAGADTHWGIPALTGAMILALGIGIGVWLDRPGEAPLSGLAGQPVLWHRQAAGFHQLTSERQAHSQPLLLDLEHEDPARLEAALNQRLERRIAVPDLSEFGLRPLGARLLVEQARPLAQIFYRGPTDKLVSLLVALDTGPDTPPRFEPANNAPMTLGWRTANTAYVLVDDSGRERMLTLAGVVAKQIHH